MLFGGMARLQVDPEVEVTDPLMCLGGIRQSRDWLVLRAGNAGAADS